MAEELPARCAFEVVAGILPGVSMVEHSRQWVLSGELQRDELEAAYQAAVEYAEHLVNPTRVNWVKLEWVWF